MSTTCPNCNHTMSNRQNVYGTICSKCGKFIEPHKKSKMEIELDLRHKMQQSEVIKYLRKLILGDDHGNKVQ